MRQLPTVGGQMSDIKISLLTMTLKPEEYAPLFGADCSRLHLGIYQLIHEARAPPAMSTAAQMMTRQLGGSTPLAARTFFDSRSVDVIAKELIEKYDGMEYQFLGETACVAVFTIRQADRIMNQHYRLHEATPDFFYKSCLRR